MFTQPGTEAGFPLSEGYSMDRALITSEMDAILAGLKALTGVSGSARYRLLMDKLAFGKPGFDKQ
ncbi:MAG: hypothetical protein ACLTBV_21485 [Enterocloster bolteae]